MDSKQDTKSPVGNVDKERRCRGGLSSREGVSPLSVRQDRTSVRTEQWLIRLMDLMDFWDGAIMHFSETLLAHISSH